MYKFVERRFEEIIAGTCVVVMCGMVFFQVIMRYVFSEPVSWSDEIAQYCMLWSVYLSVAWAVRERAHIRVMNFINLFPNSVALALTMLSDFMWLCFGIFLTWQSIVLEISFWENIYESPALGIDQKWPYLCLAFGFLLMTLRIIQIYFRWWKFDEPILKERVEERHSDSDTPHV